MTAGVIKSAERVLAVLEFFRTARRPAAAMEVARTLGWPQSSTSVLLRSMVTLGYLDYALQTRMFMPTLRVALLGDWLQEAGPVTPLTDTLAKLHKATGETVILGRQHGAHIQYLSVVREGEGLQLALKAGLLRPMTLAALGQALLSAMVQKEVRGIIRRNNAEAPSPAFRVSERETLAKLVRIRRQGYVVSEAIINPGSRVIAMLLPPQTDSVRLAVGVGGPTHRLMERFEENLDALRLYVRDFRPAVMSKAGIASRSARRASA